MSELTPQKYLSTADAAKIADCTPGYIAKLCRQGSLPGTRSDSSWLITEADLNSYLSSVENEKAKRREKLARIREEENRAHQPLARRQLSSISTFARTHAATLLLLVAFGSLLASANFMGPNASLAGVPSSQSEVAGGSVSHTIGESAFGVSSGRQMVASVLNSLSESNVPFASNIASFFGRVLAFFTGGETATLAVVPVAFPSVQPDVVTVSAPAYEPASEAIVVSGNPQTIVQNVYPTTYVTNTGISKSYVDIELARLSNIFSRNLDNIPSRASRRVGPVVGTEVSATSLSLSGDASIAGLLTVANMGVGTSSPNSTLSVQGNALFSGDLRIANLTATGTATIGTLTLASALTVPNGGTGSTTLSGILAGNGTSGIQSVVIGGGLSWDGTTLSSISGTVASGLAGQFPYYATDGSVVTATSSIFLATSGRIGVGTTNPTSPFDVRGEITSGGVNNGNSGNLNLVRRNATLQYTGYNLGYVNFGGTTDNYGSIFYGARINSRSETGGALWASGSSAANINLSTTPLGSTSPLPRIWISSQGLVGVGDFNDGSDSTTAILPSNQLDIRLSTGATAKNTDFSTLNIANAATSTTGSLVKSGLRISSTGAWTGSVASNIGLYVTAVTGGTNNYDAIFNGGGNVGIGTTTPWGQLSINPNGISGPSFAIGSSTKTDFIVTNAGYVGVGMTAPQAFVDITNRDPNNIDALYWRGSSGALSGILSNSQGTDAGVMLLKDGSAVTTVRIDGKTNSANYFNNGGNVGIGTIAPATPLHVYTSGAIPLTLERSTTGNTVIEFKNTNGSTYVGRPTSGTSNVFGIGSAADLSSSPFLSVSSGGNVGIGTTTPNNLLSVYQLIDFNNTDFTTKLGYQAGKNIVTGAQYNTFVGYQAGLSSASLSTNAADYNNAFGYQALTSNTTGTRNDAFGSQALFSNTTGNQNTAMGFNALYSNVSSPGNTAIGYQSLLFTTGGFNTGVGNGSLQTNTSGQNNTALGYAALLVNSTGSGNVALGYQAGRYELGSNSFYVNNVDQSNTANDKAYSLMYGTFSGTAGSLTGQQLVINGNVGIGSTSPYAKLSVKGAGSTTGVNFQTTNSSNSPLFTILDSGNIGIGVTNPTNTLDIVGNARITSGSNYIHLNAATQPYLHLFYSGIVDARLYPRSAATIGTISVPAGLGAYDSNSTATAGFIANKLGANGGVIAITNTAGDAQLHIAAPAGYSPFISFRENGVADKGVIGFANGSNDLQFRVNGATSMVTGTEVVRITSVGSVGIGTTTPGALFAVQGSALFSGNLTVTGLTATSTLTALRFNTTATSTAYQIGGTTVLSANPDNNNLFVGLSSGTTGNGGVAGQNIGIGQSSLSSLTSGFRNTAIGAFAGQAITTGSNNSALGYGALTANQSGQFNIALGRLSLAALLSGNSNVAIGTDSGRLMTGSNNTLLGDSAGYDQTSGSNNIIIGAAVNAPSLTGSNQLNIGNLIYGTSVQSGGVSPTSVPTGGNVGIGTTTPKVSLEVAGNLRIGTSGTRVVPTYGKGLEFMYASSNFYIEAFDYSNSSSQPLFIDGSKIALATQSGGNVGIGTSTPQSKLVVVGTATFDADGANIRIPKTTGALSNDDLGIFHYPGLGSTYGIADWSTGTKGLYINTTSGNVGIGTTTPNSKLSVFGGDIRWATAAGQAIGGTYADATDAGIGTYSNHPFGIFTNSGSYKLYVAAAGNVGVGTTAPTSKLHVAGGATDVVSLFEGTGGVQARIAVNAATTDANAGISFQEFGVDRWTLGNNGTTNALIFSTGNTLANPVATILQSGNVGIGTTTPGATFAVQGNGLFSGTLTAANLTATGTLTALSFDVSQYGSYKQNGSTILYASSTNYSTLAGISAGGALLSSGLENSAFGYQALQTATSSVDNSAFGFQALKANTSGQENTAFGASALPANTTGSYNSAFGTGALLTNTTGNRNIAIGYTTMRYNTTASDSTGVGYNALYNNNASFNTAVGSAASFVNTSGVDNVAIGADTLRNNTTGSYNTALGRSAAKGAAGHLIQGATSIGYATGNNFATGADYNTLLGYQTGYGITTGARNVLLGQSTIAASYNQVTTGSNNIAIGNDVAVPSATASNQLVIGNLIYGTGLSGTGATVSAGNIGIGTSSPSAKLTLAGSNSDTLTFVNTSASNKAWTFYPSGNDLRFYEYTGASGSAGNDRLTFQAGGNVGIGTTTPSEKLEIEGNLKLSNGSGSGALRTNFITDHINFNTAITLTRPNVVFNVNSWDNGHFEFNGGNVGIGTTSPVSKLAVEGTSNILTMSGTSANAANYINFLSLGGSSARNDWRLGTGIGVDDGFEIYDATAGGPLMRFTRSSAGASTGTLNFYTNAATARLTIDTSGNVGIGTASPTQKFEVIGNIYSNTGNFLVTGEKGLQWADNGSYIARFGATGDFIINPTVGNVGIGTSNPTSLLYLSSDTPVLTLSNASSTSFHGIEFRGGSSLDASIKQQPNTGEFRFDVGRNASWGGKMTFYTDTVERMRITDTGNVGIGTTNPTSKLNIVADDDFVTVDSGSTGFWGLKLRGSGGGVDVASLQANGGTGEVRIGGIAASYFPTFYAGNAEAMRITTSGNVGVGITVPLYKLDINGGSTASQLHFSSGGADSGGYLVSASANNFFMSGGASFNGSNWVAKSTEASLIGSSGVTSGDLAFYTNSGLTAGNTYTPTNRMVITSTGNVGIGTTTPSSKLVVQGSSTGNVAIGSWPGDTTYGGITLNGATAFGDYNFYSTGSGARSLTINRPTGGSINFSANNTPQMVLDASGNVGIGTASPAYKLDVVGVLRTTGAAYVQSLAVGGTDATVGGGTAVVNHNGSFPNGFIINATAAAVAPAIYLRNAVDATAALFRFPANGINFLDANDNNRLAITSTGNVGIGTTSPSQKLDVNGGIAGDFVTFPRSDSLTGLMYISSRPYTSLAAAGARTNDLIFSLSGGGSIGEAMRITTGGNVGIGTTSPQTNVKLDVHGRLVAGLAHVGESALTTSAGEFWLPSKSLVTIGESSAGDANPAITLYRTSAGYSSGRGVRIYSPTSAGVMQFQISAAGGTYGTETYNTAMQIVSAGYVNIATTTVQSMLAVQGTGGANLFDLYGTAGANRFTVTNGGNVGIGTTSPTAKFSIGVAGDPLSGITSDGSYIAFNYQGDTRYKLASNGYGELGLPSGFDGGALLLESGTSGRSAISGGASGVGKLSFFTNNNLTAAGMTLTGTGLGVGVTAPDAKLEIGGAEAADEARIIFAASDASNRFTIETDLDGTTSNDMLGFRSTLADNILVLRGSGNVGIGTSSPATKLQVLGTDSTNGQLRVSYDQTNYVSFMVKSGGDTHIKPSGTSGLYLNGTYSGSNFFNVTELGALVQNSSANSYFSGAGNVGIGAAAPIGKLDVVGNILSRGTSVSYTGITNAGVFNYDTVNGFLDLAAYSTGGNTAMRFTTSNAGTSGTRMTISNTGNVGIGTTSPYAKLSVTGTGGTTRDLVVNGRIQTGDANNQGGVWFGQTDQAQFIGQQSATTLGFYTNSDWRMVINSSGNVGIGTTNPGNKLTVSGTGSGIISAVDTSSTGYSGVSLQGTGTQNYSLVMGGPSESVFGIANKFALYDGLAGAMRFVVDSSGNVGIGTTSPVSKLAVEGTSNILTMSGTSANAANYINFLSLGGSSARNDWRLGTGIGVDDGFEIYDATAGGPLMRFTRSSAGASTGTLNFYTNAATARLTIDTSGNVGIGTTTPNARLNVYIGPAGVAPTANTSLALESNASNYLSILAPSASATGIFFGNPTGANRGGILFNDASSLDGLIFRTGGNSTRMTITSAGNVGIGTTTPAAQLTTTGTVQFANFGAGSLQTDANGNLSVSSDERLKTLNGSFTRGLDAVLGLSPILYHWNATSKLDQATQYAGFSAQNVKASIPEAVDTDPRGYLTLSDRPILAASINAIKELNNKTITLGEYASTTGRTVEDLGLALDMIASTTIATTSSSTPGSIRFATSFWKNVFAKVSEWIGDSANGIKTVVAGQLRAKESICVDDQCLSKDDVRVLLEMARERGSAGVGASVNTPTPTPTPEPVSPAPTDDPSVVTPPTPVTETPAPTPTPEPQPAPTPEPVVTAPVSPTPEPVTASPVTVEATTPTAATPAI